MELSARKQAIILAVVDEYIRTGEPIGSKALTELLENAPSSATLRNEMSELCELGFLEQPHTSAGRIPTSNAYKLYVENLPPQQLLSSPRREAIDRMIYAAAENPEQICAGLSRIVSNLTGLPALCTTISEENSHLTKVQLIPLGRHSAMLVVVTSHGRALSRLCRTSGEITSENVSLFEKISKERIIGVPVGRITPAFLQSIMVSASATAFSFMPIFNVLFEMIGDVGRAKLEIDGQAKLFSLCRSDSEAREILSLFDRKEALISMLSDITKPINVLFGSEMHFARRNPSTIIIASFNTGNGEYGRIGVVGPERMSYGQIIPSLTYIADKAGDIMKQALTDMED